MYKTAVVGLGLIGSAAARHLADTGDGIVGIGPAEPAHIAEHVGVFASHYDEGRMTRIVDPTTDWAHTARSAIERYADIEERSGISVFNPAGYLGIGQPGNDYNARCAAAGSAAGATTTELAAEEMRARFPYLNVRNGEDGLLELETAGHISPRSMVAAQTKLAESAGAKIIRSAATAIRSTPTGVEIDTADGSRVEAERVLVAAGGFTSACGLSPADLGLTVFGRTAVFAKITPDVAPELDGMPTLIHCTSGAYILPPILYPDGNTYLKLGIGTDDDPTFDTVDGLQQWFTGEGSDDNRRDFRAFITDLIPALERCTDWHTATCVVTRTRSGLPIIDFVDDHQRVAVAVGGNGKGAKGSDEWGRIAAGLVRDEPWSSPVDRAALAL